MRAIGVREFRTNVSKILEQVSSKGETFEITRHGRVIARLMPAGRPAPIEAEMAAVWEDLDRLSEEISALWPEGVSAAEAVAGDRR